MDSILERMIDRRTAIGAGLGVLASFGLAACGSSSSSSETSATTTAATTTAATTESEDETPQLDATAYDALIAAGPVADDATIAASEWATKVSEAGSMRVGSVQTSTYFSLLNEEDGVLRGFDAGLSQLLARYITGDEGNIENTQVTSDTRESVLVNDQVDAVFATYSINDERKEVISFAGPYYSTETGILTLADNTDINSVDDLADKNVAVQSGSTGPKTMEKYCPDATLSEFKTDQEARTALEQGRVDAYVIDTNMLQGSMAANPGKYRLAANFGDVDPYGIGLPKDSDGVDFVNAFLQEIEDEGIWADLWQICLGDRQGIDSAPEPPEIGA